MNYTITVKGGKMNDSSKIPYKNLRRMKKNTKLKPIINLLFSDTIDVHSIKKHSPNVEAEREYRVCLGNLPNDKGVNKFAVKMRDFDVSIGLNQISIKEIPLSKMKRWKDYKAIQFHLRDYKPYEECQILEINKFIDFCEKNNITEKQLWYYLLDDTYSKSKEIIYTFYPTIIPIPRQYIKYQRLNSHCLLLTQSKSGKTYTCQKLYPIDNYEGITSKTLMGTVKKEGIRKGILDGQGICFIDEINKLKRTSIGESENDKILDYINNFLELGKQRRGVWGEVIEISGTKTVIFSGNVNIIKPGEKDFYHLMSCICKFSGDSDKFGRRFAFFVYGNNLNDVQERETDEQVLNIINSLRKEIICNKKIQKKIIKLYDNSLDYIEEKDEEHIQKLREYRKQVSSSAIQSFIKGMSKTSHKKLKFMSIKITIANHIFEIIKKKKNNFLEKYKEEIEETYKELKELLIYKQIENLINTNLEIDTKKNKIINFIKEKNINVNERISEEEKEKISKELNIPFRTIKNTIQEMRDKS